MDCIQVNLTTVNTDTYFNLLQTVHILSRKMPFVSSLNLSQI